jgi:O-antigen ligase
LLITVAFGLSLFFNGTDLPYLLSASGLLVLLAGSVAARRAWTGGATLPRSWVAAGLVVLWGYWGLSLAWSTVPFTSFLYYWWLSALPLTFFALVLWRDRAAVRGAAAALTLGAAVLAVWALVQYFVYPDTYGYRAKGPLLNPNNLGALFNLFLLPWAAFILGGQRSPWLTGAGMALAWLLFAGVMATQSRGAMLSLGIAGAVLVVALYRQPAWRWARLALLAAGGLLIFIGMDAWTGSAQLVERVGSIGQASSAGSVETRFAIWASTWEMIRDHFWLGTGLGTFFLYYSQYRTPADAGSGGFYAHMDPLQFWAEMGVAAPLLFYAVLTLILLRTLRYGRWGRMRPGVIGPFAGLLAVALHTHLTFNLYVLPILIGAGVWLAYWYRASDGGAAQPAPEGGAGRLGWPRTAGVALGVAALLGATSLGAAATQPWLMQASNRALERGEYTKALRYAQLVHRFVPSSQVPFEQAVRVRLRRLQQDKLPLSRRQYLFEETRALLHRARARNPARSELYELEGRLYLEGARFIGPEWRYWTEGAWRKALRMDPRKFPTRLNLARFLGRQGRHREAITVMKAGLDWPLPAAGQAQLYLEIAEAYRALGERERARAMARRGVGKADDPDVRRKARAHFGLTDS